MIAYLHNDKQISYNKLKASVVVIHLIKEERLSFIRSSVTA